MVSDSSEKSQAKIEELNSEIRKLKAMIGRFWIMNMREYNYF